jgi:hypothetical protein
VRCSRSRPRGAAELARLLRPLRSRRAATPAHRASGPPRGRPLQFFMITARQRGLWACKELVLAPAPLRLIARLGLLAARHTAPAAERLGPPRLRPVQTFRVHASERSMWLEMGPARAGYLAPRVRLGRRRASPGCAGSALPTLPRAPSLASALLHAMAQLFEQHSHPRARGYFVTFTRMSPRPPRRVCQGGLESSPPVSRSARSVQPGAPRRIPHQRLRCASAERARAGGAVDPAALTSTARPAMPHARRFGGGGAQQRRRCTAR